MSKWLGSSETMQGVLLKMPARACQPDCEGFQPWLQAKGQWNMSLSVPKLEINHGDGALGDGGDMGVEDVAEGARRWPST